MTRTLATARRVLQQLSHDPRSIAMIVVLPSLLLLLFKYVYDGNPACSTAWGRRCSASSRSS